MYKSQAKRVDDNFESYVVAMVTQERGSMTSDREWRTGCCERVDGWYFSAASRTVMTNRVVSNLCA